MAFRTITALDAATTTGAGNALDVGGYTLFTGFIVGSGISAGGTVAIQSLCPDGTTWATLNTTTVSANGGTAVTFEGVHSNLRANVTARTDGTYSVFLRAYGPR